jgi:hypothetical protein
MPFIQLIEYRTSRWDEMDALMKQWRQDTEGRRTVERTTICIDRSGPSRYMAIVEFPSYEAAMENSNLPETEELAEAVRAICDEPPVFHNLEVSQILQDQD